VYVEKDSLAHRALGAPADQGPDAYKRTASARVQNKTKLDRYLVNSLRDMFQLTGTPVRLTLASHRATYRSRRALPHLKSRASLCSDRCPL
jgi:hypothetical protein